MMKTPIPGGASAEVEIEVDGAPGFLPGAPVRRRLLPSALCVLFFSLAVVAAASVLGFGTSGQGHLLGLGLDADLERASLTTAKLRLATSDLWPHPGTPQTPWNFIQARKHFDISLEAARDQPILRGYGLGAILSRLSSESGRYDMALRHGGLLAPDGSMASPFPQDLAEAATHYANLLSLVDEYSLTTAELSLGLEQSRRNRIGALTVFGFFAAVGLFGSLAWFGVYLRREVFRPLGRLAEVAGGPEGADELAVVGARLHALSVLAEGAALELAEKSAQLKSAEALAQLGKVAAGVAHGIRNPLTSIKMRLFSLRRAHGGAVGDQTETDEDFAVITEEVGHIDDIVRSFLDFSRPPKLTLKLASPSVCVDASLTQLGPRLAASGVRIELYREDPMPEILLDAERVKELLSNLLANACEAMPGGGKISVAEEEGFLEPYGSVVILQVDDNGPGVPASLRERIFEPFYTTKEEGTGLGLPLARRIAEEHGGTLTLSASKSGGARFTLILPKAASGKGRARWR